MIVVRLMGGLGNQMFQYAIGRRLSIARDAPLVLDLDWYHRSSGSSTPRSFELHRYPTAARVATTMERLSFRARASRIGHRHPWLQLGWKFYREATFDHDPSVLHLSGNVHLDGYWQSPLYFENIADVLRADLTPTARLSSRDVEIANQISQSNSVSVHVRRGDYVNNPSATAHHGTCTPEYYQRALALIGATHMEPHLFVFSDDTEWSRIALSLPGRVTFVDHNGPDAAFQDLRLMSMCTHHVIANSSFSWWGAWLNPSPQQMVIAPSSWFADGRATPSLLPPNWKRI